MRKQLTAHELVELHRTLPSVDYEQMCAEADEFFGDPDQLVDERPAGRSQRG